MKIEFIEHEGCFGIDLTAEDMKDAALLTRLGMNRTNEMRYCCTAVTRDGQFTTSLTIAKSKKADSSVPKRK